MAISSPTLPLSLILVCSIILALSSTVRVDALGPIVGGVEEIPNVKANKDIQNLGEYCVCEYNKNTGKYIKGGNGTGGPVTFLEVVEGKQQVVAGVKYYLKISTKNSSGEPKIFDAVVVERLWEKTKRRELLTFTPSPPTK